MLRRSLVVLLAFIAIGIATCQDHDTHEAEAARLAALLGWKPGTIVADVGAGEGQMTLAAARRVGATGKVYTTELDAKKRAHLEELAAKEKNLVALRSTAASANLPPECCDSIFMRLVYHHLTQPAEFDASLLRSLKLGGRLAVIDEYPVAGMSLPEGVPANRGGHGIPEKLLADELKNAGFQVVTEIDPWADWPNHHHNYCVVFRKAAP